MRIMKVAFEWLYKSEMHFYRQEAWGQASPFGGSVWLVGQAVSVGTGRGLCGGCGGQRSLGVVGDSQPGKACILEESAGAPQGSWAWGPPGVTTQ